MFPPRSLISSIQRWSILGERLRQNHMTGAALHHETSNRPAEIMG